LNKIYLYSAGLITHLPVSCRKPISGYFHVFEKFLRLDMLKVHKHETFVGYGFEFCIFAFN